MEVGAVKQAFNNELIKLKKNLNQAKIQIIHKLTRKSKAFLQKKAPEKLQEKLKRKSESAVNEVLIIKKIKVKDLAKFMLTHKGDLKNQLNNPKVDTDKACARLLLHKSLHDRYIFIRDRFGNVPINDLLMSRQERRKLKKEAKENKKNKKAGKNNDLEKHISNKLDSTELQSNSSENPDDSVDEDDSKEQHYANGQSLDMEQEFVGYKLLNKMDDIVKTEDDSDIEMNHSKLGKELMVDKSKSGNETDSGKFVKSSTAEEKSKPAISKIKKPIAKSFDDVLKIARETKTVIRKVKDNNKNKNLNEKLLCRKFKKDDNTVTPETKVVDPFFITETGDNYLSVAEPRKADEIKEVHKQGNRRHRRAVMFGHALPYQTKQDNFKSNYSNDYSQDKLRGNIADLRSKDDSFKNKSHSQTRFSKNKFEESKVNAKDEKLHPSWEAKKKQSGLLPFQGKKIVFSDS